MLAFNDVSLVRGGLFDYQATWAAPHQYHRDGRDADVRANTAENAVPHDNAIRQWFTARIIGIFGRTAGREFPGQAFEHYHIYGW
jgi:hypothetical protein